jgi:tetratricopeptide (TPR) repeat protein
MTEDEYLARIRHLWAGPDPDVAQALAVARQAVSTHPRSARLLCALGDLLQLAGDGSDPLDVVLECYERAAAADPTSSEAFTSMGYYHDVVTQDLDAAEVAFRKALTLGGNEDSIVGLARVFAQQCRRRDDIVALLETAPDQASPRVCQMRREIESGEWEP